MEPFEWLLLGIGLAVGGLLGAKGKDVARSAAEGYFVVTDKTRGLTEKTRDWTAEMREGFRDAVEEARYERAQEARVAEPEPVSSGRKPRAARAQAKPGAATAVKTRRKRATQTPAGSDGAAQSDIAAETSPHAGAETG